MREELNYDAIINYCAHKLGAPVVMVELLEEHFKTALESALDEFYKGAGGRYKLVKEWSFMTNPGQTRYDSVPEDLNFIVSIASRGTNILGVTGVDDWLLYWNSEANRQFFRDVADFYISNGFIDTARRTVGSERSWELINTPDGNFLGLYGLTSAPEKIIVRYAVKPTIQNISEYNKWVKDWALAECKEILGRIRSKFESGYPVALNSGGGLVQLDGKTLLEESKAEKADLRARLVNWRTPLYAFFA
jgi:hypothetical protein